MITKRIHWTNSISQFDERKRKRKVGKPNRAYRRWDVECSKGTGKSWSIAWDMNKGMAVLSWWKIVWILKLWIDTTSNFNQKALERSKYGWLNYKLSLRTKFYLFPVSQQSLVKIKQGFHSPKLQKKIRLSKRKFNPWSNKLLFELIKIYNK